MDNLSEMRKLYVGEGLSYTLAIACVAQDVTLDLISKSALSQHVTIKGGVLMQCISQDARRTTVDFDFDFVRYSISDDSIKGFIKALNREGLLGDLSKNEEPVKMDTPGAVDN